MFAPVTTCHVPGCQFLLWWLLSELRGRWALFLSGIPSHLRGAESTMIQSSPDALPKQAIQIYEPFLIILFRLHQSNSALHLLFGSAVAKGTMSFDECSCRHVRGKIRPATVACVVGAIKLHRFRHAARAGIFSDQIPHRSLGATSFRNEPRDE